MDLSEVAGSVRKHNRDSVLGLQFQVWSVTPSTSPLLAPRGSCPQGGLKAPGHSSLAIFGVTGSGKCAHSLHLNATCKFHISGLSSYHFWLLPANTSISFLSMCMSSDEDMMCQCSYSQVPPGRCVYTLKCLISFREANLNVSYQMLCSSQVILSIGLSREPMFGSPARCLFLTCLGAVWVANGPAQRTISGFLHSVQDHIFTISSPTPTLAPPGQCLRATRQKFPAKSALLSFPALHYVHPHHHSNPRSWTKRSQIV